MHAGLTAKNDLSGWPRAISMANLLGMIYSTVELDIPSLVVGD